MATAPAAAMAEKERGEDGKVAEIEKKIREAFEVFDRESNKTVDARDIGCIVRSLGCFPSEVELRELLAKGMANRWDEEVGKSLHILFVNGHAALRSGRMMLELRGGLVEKEEEEEATRFIHLEKFLPVMTKVLLDRSYWPIREDVLLHAFEALDENKCGYITKEDLVKYLTEEGEPFTQEEMEEMLSIALDPETDTLHYRDYLSKLVVDETKIFPFHV